MRVKNAKKGCLTGCFCFILGAFFTCTAFSCALAFLGMEYSPQKTEIAGAGQVATPTPVLTPAPTETITLEPTPAGPQQRPILVLTEVPPMPTVSAVSTSTPVFITRIKIEEIGVDAQVVEKGVEKNNGVAYIGAPEKAADVAHFSYSGLPGQGRPILMNGHIAWIENGETVNGVFRELGKLDPSVNGNIKIVLSTSDGKEYDYVVQRRLFRLQMNETEVEQILNLEKDEEVLILISCYWPYEKGQGYLDRIFILAYPQQK